MDFYRDFQNTDAFKAYKEVLVRYISSLDDESLFSLFNELMREIRYPEVYRMDDINDLFCGLSFTEAMEQIDKESFDLSDEYIRYDETYGLWNSYSNLEDAGGIDIDPDCMANELLHLDISKYTEIEDSYVLKLIEECEREAGHEMQLREMVSQKLKADEEHSVFDDADITLRG